MKISPKHMVVVALAIGVVAVLVVFGRLGDGPESESGSREGSGAVAGSGSRASGGYVSGKSRTRGGSSPGGAGGGERASKSPRGKAGGGAPGPTEPGRTRTASAIQNILEKKKEGIAVFDEDYKLSKEVAEALGLTDKEYGMVNQTLRNTLGEIDDLREKNVEVRQKSDSQLFMKIRSFGEEGAEVQASMEDNLRQQLGDERYASFMLMSGDALSDEYFQFGKAYQTISFNLYESQNDGASRIRIVDRLHVPQEGGDWAVIENQDNYNSLPPAYAPFFELANSGAPKPIPVSSLPQPPPVEPAPE